MAGAGRVTSLQGGLGGGPAGMLGASSTGQTGAGGGEAEVVGWSSLDLGSSVTSGSLSWSQTLKVVEEAAGLTKS
jgi:hypothetical protein